MLPLISLLTLLFPAVYSNQRSPHDHHEYESCYNILGFLMSHRQHYNLCHQIYGHSLRKRLYWRSERDEPNNIISVRFW